MQKYKPKRVIAMLLMLPVLSGCGAGKSDVTTVEPSKDTDTAASTISSNDTEITIEPESNSESGTNAYPEEALEDYSYEYLDPVEFMKTRPVTYSTQNELTKSEKLSSAPIEVSIKNFCDSSAIEYAEEHKCMDHLLWLADYAVNVVEPQAVEKVLQIPAFAEAAKNGEISRYISVYITYNDVNHFGAMEQSCYLGRDGHGLSDWDSPFYYIGHNILVNLSSFLPEEKDDPYTLRFLESAMIHEIMHAFMIDYLFNLSLGTGRDGARVLERDSNGKIIMNEDDRPNHLDEIPLWLQEGIAMTVENPYGTRCGELKDMIDPEATDDEYLEILSDPAYLDSYINVDFLDEGLVNIAKLTEDENAYTTGWVASLFLCAMAGYKLGYAPFDENGYLSTEAVFYGINELLTSIHDGHSLDYVIADLSYGYDPEHGYKDTADFEERCFGSVDDPGLIFMQQLLFDLESRSIIDPEKYMPCASVLPGYVNGSQSCMDSSYHSPAKVYEVDNIIENNPLGEYYSISTIPMANIALTGGRRTSYDPYLNPLSADEEAERNHGYIGDQKKYIDLSLEDD